jgi:hypothetical protein
MVTLSEGSLEKWKVGDEVCIVGHWEEKRRIVLIWHDQVLLNREVNGFVAWGEWMLAPYDGVICGGEWGED